MRDILAKLVELANDPAAKTVINEFLDSQSLGAYKENIALLLSTLPNALKYQNYDEKSGVGSGECTYVKRGLKFVEEYCKVYDHKVPSDNITSIFIAVRNERRESKHSLQFKLHLLIADTLSMSHQSRR